MLRSWKILCERQEHLFQEILRWIRVGLCLDPKPYGIIITICVGLTYKGNPGGCLNDLSSGHVSISFSDTGKHQCWISLRAASDSLCCAFSQKHTGKQENKTKHSKLLKQPQKCMSEWKWLRNCCKRQEGKVAKRWQPMSRDI